MGAKIALYDYISNGMYFLICTVKEACIVCPGFVAAAEYNKLLRQMSLCLTNNQTNSFPSLGVPGGFLGDFAIFYQRLFILHC